MGTVAFYSNLSLSEWCLSGSYWLLVCIFLPVYVVECCFHRRLQGFKKQGTITLILDVHFVFASNGRKCDLVEVDSWSLALEKGIKKTKQKTKTEYKQ